MVLKYKSCVLRYTFNSYWPANERRSFNKKLTANAFKIPTIFKIA